MDGSTCQSTCQCESSPISLLMDESTCQWEFADFSFPKREHTNVTNECITCTFAHHIYIYIYIHCLAVRWMIQGGWFRFLELIYVCVCVCFVVVLFVFNCVVVAVNVVVSFYHMLFTSCLNLFYNTCGDVWSYFLFVRCDSDF